jgi:membrane protein YqaA with SNARE-associated domain
MFASSAAALAVCSLVFYWLLPGVRGVLWLALYSIPSHMFVSPLPHEPMLLYFAKIHGATLCAAASLFGCLVAGLWDYWLFVPLMHHPRIRSKYAHVGLYKRSVRLFRKSPFLALVFAGFTPFPFYPVKFLSISDHYPLRKYLLALTVGRTPRYWILGYLGYVVRFPNWSLVLLALAFLVFTIVQSRREVRRDAEADGAAREPAAEFISLEASARSISSGK